MLVENLEAVLAMGLAAGNLFQRVLLDRLSGAEVERTSKALRENNTPITFHAPFMDLNPGAVDEKSGRSRCCGSARF